MKPNSEPDTNAAAVLLGRKGGLSSSEAKTAAARKNGKKGGRPKGKARTAVKALIAVLCLLFAGCASPISPSSPAQGVRLTLLVYSDTGTPIPVASAIVNGQSFEIRRGMASLTIQAGTPIDVQISADGYLGIRDSLTFENRARWRHLTATSWSFYLRKPIN